MTATSQGGEEMQKRNPMHIEYPKSNTQNEITYRYSLSGEPDYFGRNEISSGGDLSHYSSASLY